MITLAAAAAYHMLIIFTVDGREIIINPHEITSLAEQREEKEGKFHSSIHCVVTLTDGRFISVSEECEHIRERIEAMKE